MEALLILLVFGLAGTSLGLDDPAIGTNLIVNGGAEQYRPIDPDRPDGLADFEGWRRDGGVFRNSYESYPVNHLGSDETTTGFGMSYFLGGDPGRIVDQSRLSQQVDVTSLAESIDAGRIRSTFSGWVGGRRQAPSIAESDRVTVRAVYRDAEGDPLGETVLPMPDDADFDRPSDEPNLMIFRQAQVDLPKGTRTITVELLFVRKTGRILNAHADEISLVLDTR